MILPWTISDSHTNINNYHLIDNVYLLMADSSFITSSRGGRRIFKTLRTSCVVSKEHNKFICNDAAFLLAVAIADIVLFEFKSLDGLYSKRTDFNV